MVSSGDALGSVLAKNSGLPTFSPVYSVYVFRGKHVSVYSKFVGFAWPWKSHFLCFRSEVR